MKEPGRRLRAFAASVCTIESLSRLVDPAIADFQKELQDVRSRGSAWQSGRVSLMGYVSVVAVLAVALCRDAFDPRRWSPEDRGSLRRALLWSAGSAVALTALLVSPMVHATWAITTAAEAAIPIATALGVGAAVIGRAVSFRTAVGVFAIAFAMSLAALVNTGSIRPLEYRAHHEKIRQSRGAGEAFGDSEMSIWQLRHEIGAARNTDTYRLRVYNYQAEWFMIVAPFLVAVPVLSIAVHRRLTHWRFVLTVVATYLLSVIGLVLSRSPFVSDEWVMTAIWLPQTAVFVASFLALLTLRSSRSIA